MKAKLNRLSANYRTALRQRLNPGPQTGSARASGLGSRAAALGLETLDLARIHEQALATLLSPGGSARAQAGTMQRANIFFGEAVAPIEEAHRAARAADGRTPRRSETLGHRTAALTASAQHLRQDIVHHEAAEQALRQSVQQNVRLLADSRHRATRLRHGTHEILVAQEQERLTMSHQLQDEIVQGLLGINVRLWALRRAARDAPATLRKEIASVQRLVEESLQSIERFAHELDSHPAA